MERIEHPDYLYVSHLHADHLDEPWLADHVDRGTPVLLPGYPDARAGAQAPLASASSNIIAHRRRRGARRSARPARSPSTSRRASPTAPAVTLPWSSATARPGSSTRTTAAPTTSTPCAAHGPVDLHWLQYSGAIWYPMVYDEPRRRMRELVDAKVDSQFATGDALRRGDRRPRRRARAPGPPAFLDPELFRLNVITGDELSIFPDQRGFLESPAPQQAIAASWPSPAPRSTSADGSITVTHPMPDDDGRRHLRPQGRRTSRDYQADWMPWLDRDAAQLAAPEHRPAGHAAGVVGAAAGHGADAARRRSEHRACCAPATCDVLIDFPIGDVRAYAGEPYAFRFDIQRELVETVAAQRAVDWSNALFLSCRFRAWRAGRVQRVPLQLLQVAVGRAHAPRRGRGPAQARPEPATSSPTRRSASATTSSSALCPHRHADLSVFGEIDGGELVCTLHGWPASHSRRADHPLTARRFHAANRLRYV